MENITFTILNVERKKCSIDEFRAGKPLVLDFWHTKCTRCPAALEKLNIEAEKALYDGVIFASCGISVEDGDIDLVSEMCEGEWENLTHLYMTKDEKETAKAAFGFTAVPFCIVIDTSGNIIFKGDPKLADFESLLSGTPTKSLETATVFNEAATLSFDDDF